MKLCAVCHTKAPDNAAHCLACGEASWLPAPEPKPAPEPQSHTPLASADAERVERRRRRS